MKHIYETYQSLLADVFSLAHLPLRAPALDWHSWCIYDAPRLEKNLLMHLEANQPLADEWPDWIIPLRNLALEESSGFYLRLLRQILLFCYKAEHEYTKDSEAQAYSEWLSNNHRVSKWTLPAEGTDARRVLNLARCMVQELVRDVDWKEIIPFHGPGAVTNARKGDKGHFKKWYQTINEMYPYYDYFGVSRIYLNEADVETLEYPDTIEARMICVPKDSRGPRLICVHPEEAIWIQQGQRILLESTARKRVRIRPVHRFVNFTDQTVNGEIALSSSEDLKWSTIDLRQASDSLSSVLVEYLFGDAYQYLACSRAEYALLPPDVVGESNSRVRIAAFAPMGNALTFPVQSFCYWALCNAAMIIRAERNNTNCYVFGDDIICPTPYFSIITDSLEEFGLVVNRGKSFSRSRFRESCGVDAYNGLNVTPVRWRTTFDIRSLAQLVSLIDTAQRLRCEGYEQAALTAYSICRRVAWSQFRLRIPYVNTLDHGGIAIYTELESLVWEQARWNRDVQWFCVRVPKATHVQLSTGRHGWNHVLSDLTSLEKSGRGCQPALAVSSRPKLKLDWVKIG